MVVGGTFLVHGLDKLIDLSATESYFASLDIPAPGLMAPFVVSTETTRTDAGEPVESLR